MCDPEGNPAGPGRLCTRDGATALVHIQLFVLLLLSITDIRPKKIHAPNVIDD
jgi:hypothetical protein